MDPVLEAARAVDVAHVGAAYSVVGDVDGDGVIELRCVSVSVGGRDGP